MSADIFTADKIYKNRYNGQKNTMLIFMYFLHLIFLKLLDDKVLASIILIMSYNADFVKKL